MVQLHIALQEGFEQETVVIRYEGRAVFHKQNVTTKLQIGFADSFEMGVTEGAHRIQIVLPTKNLSETVELQVSNPAYLGVSILDGKITHRVSQEPFGYL